MVTLITLRLKNISASVERDDHYVEIVGCGTTNLNSQALVVVAVVVVVGVSVLNSSAQSRRRLTTPLLSIKIIFCLTTSQLPTAITPTPQSPDVKL